MLETQRGGEIVVNTEVLTDIIEKSGLKREYIAQRLGITRQTLTAKIAGDSEFSVSEVRALCDVLGIKKLRDINQIFFMRG